MVVLLRFSSVQPRQGMMYSVDIGIIRDIYLLGSMVLAKLHIHQRLVRIDHQRNLFEN